MRLMRPDHLLWVVVIYALGTGLLMVHLATDRPWLGLRLVYDQTAEAAVVVRAEGPGAGIPEGTALRGITTEEGEFRFVADDFIVETDGVLATYADYDEFIRRQERLAGLQAAAVVRFVDVEGREWPVIPGPSRPVRTLPPEFWVPVAVGVIAWLIAAGVWVFRRGETSARFLLLSGWCTLLFAPTSAVYATRELALPGELFRWLSDLNFLGGSLFAGAMVALMACYPRRIGPAWLGLAAVLAQAAWWVAQQVGVFDSMIMARRVLVMVALLGTFMLAFVQWRGTRRDPVGRAALRWFLLSWVVGSGVFGLLILLPQMFGLDTTPVQAYAFLLFVLVYVGLAFGILRFRLFGLDEWWVRIVTWLGALLLLVVLDLVFIFQLRVSAGASLSLSLVICGLLWLPLRGFVSGRLLARKESDRPDLFKAVVDAALAPAAGVREARWRECLRLAFDPLRMEPASREGGDAALADDGLALLLPSVDGLPSLRLEYARGGRGLFSPRDVAQAGELTGMLRHALEGRDAYEKGVLVERARIARDMHDNVGAQLLRALHTREEGRRESLLRETLSDLRGIINDAANPNLSLEEALAELRYETAERLSAAGIELEWRVESGEAGAPVSAKAAHALRPLVRETVSNVVKHAGAHRVEVEIERRADGLLVAVEDDGKGFDPGAVRAGNGLANMQARIAALGGTIAWVQARARGRARGSSCICPGHSPRRHHETRADSRGPAGDQRVAGGDCARRLPWVRRGARRDPASRDRTGCGAKL